MVVEPPDLVVVTGVVVAAVVVLPVPVVVVEMGRLEVVVVLTLVARVVVVAAPGWHWWYPGRSLDKRPRSSRPMKLTFVHDHAPGTRVTGTAASPVVPATLRPNRDGADGSSEDGCRGEELLHDCRIAVAVLSCSCRFLVLLFLH